MNGSGKIFSMVMVLAILLLCFIFISLLLPALFNSINEQVASTQKVHLLKTEIYDVQEYPQAAHFPRRAALAPKTLSKIKAEYKTARIENIINTLTTAAQAFLTWLIIAIATRLFNDYCYPTTQAFIQRKWQQLNNKTV